MQATLGMKQDTGNFNTGGKMVRYKSTFLRKEFDISEIFTIHYFEYMSDFVFDGERHDFWEFVCVDSGRIIVTSETDRFFLTKGEMYFHKPNEWHALQADGVSSPNLFVISFNCNSEYMNFFAGRKVVINSTERFYLGQILKETERAFSTELENPYYSQLQRRETSVFGSEQIILNSLEFLLLSIYRRYHEEAPLLSVSIEEPVHPTIHRKDTELINEVEQFMQQNIYGSLTVSEICRSCSIGRTSLENIFHKEKDYGVIEHFSRMKIEEAKKLIRNGHLNFNQIANTLGYSSYQYFSLQFKKYTHLSPSEYRTTILNFSTDQKAD